MPKDNRKIKKGDLVRILSVDDNFATWRARTSAEIRAWYAAPENQGMADDGETRLCSYDVYVSIPARTTCIVVRPRCRARLSYRSVPSCCELFDPQSGTVFFIQRSNVVQVQ